MSDMHDLLYDLENLVEMLESDMQLTGNYEMTPETKKYVNNVRDELLDIINKYRSIYPDEHSLYILTIT